MRVQVDTQMDTQTDIRLRLYQLLIFSPCCHAVMIYAKDDVEVGVCVECGEDYPTVSAETDEWM